MYPVKRLWQAAVVAWLLINVPDASAQGRIVRCEARNEGYTRCRMLIRGPVRLYRQLSHASCRFNETWGYDSDGIWVVGGCRADFLVEGGRDKERWDDRERSRDYDGWGWEDKGRNREGWSDRDYDQGYRRDGRVILCESNDDQYRYCPAKIRGGVSLRRQLSRSGCREGSSWGYDGGGIWVNRGCRGEFVVR